MADKKILVVDDEQEVLELLEQRLSDQAYEVITAKAGRETIQKARNDRPQLILLDIVLPDMEGSEVARHLAEDPLTADIPILFLSGIVSKEENMPSEVNVGGRLYKAIGKPFSFDDLLSEIRKAID